MNFSKKLDLLINLTKTSNKELADVLFFSQSYVSKLRRGHRILNDIESIDRICSFFAKRIFLPSQIDILRNTIRWGYLSENPSTEEIRIFLMEGFFVNSSETIEKIDKVISHLNEHSSQPDKKVKILSDYEEKNLQIEDVGSLPSYYQNKQIFLKFLDDILMSDNIEYAFISTNTNTFGFVEDLEVSEKVNKVINHIVEKKVKFDIIFNLARPLFEMIDVIDRWLYLMFKGNVNIWYLFDAEENFTSHFVFGVSGIGSYNCYGLKDSDICDVVAFYDTFKDYKRVENQFLQTLSKVEPLLIKYDPSDFKDQSKYSLSLLEGGETATISKFLSIYTMPDDLLKELLDNKRYKYLYEITNSLQQRFNEFIKDNKFIDIIDSSILSLDSVVRDSFWGYNYTNDQLKRHLGATLETLKNNKNYTLVESDNIEDYTLFKINKEAGALMIFFGNDATEGLFTNSPIVTSTLETYLKLKFFNRKIESKEVIIEKLERKIESLT